MSLDSSNRTKKLDTKSLFQILVTVLKTLLHKRHVLAELLGTPSIYRVLGHPPPLYSELLRQPVIMYLLHLIS